MYKLSTFFFVIALQKHMKRVLSILLTGLILLSGMHFSVASHICGGKVTEIKVSFSKKEGSCGMENNSRDCSNGTGVSSNCCKNEIDTYVVDSSYSKASFQFNVLNQLIPVYYMLTTNIVAAYDFLNLSTYSDTPPERSAVTEVYQSYICVYRN